ncbi:MAG: hypothetical protein M3Y24_11805 [Acidobacteriota bacterium]|nr:hypothetical protein [Acidobacteriota bacterium]
MNNVLALSASPVNSSLEHDDLENNRKTRANPVNLDDLAHDLRQPLSTIESLAYYLEITTVDDQVCGYLEKIRHMVNRANGILDHAIVA